MPHTVKSDPIRLKQILNNLVSNALKYTYRGTISIKCNYDSANCMLKVLISDTGCGILKRDLSKITKMFARVFSGKQMGSGVGLGLYICKHITREFGGDIVINSEPGQGSKIEFTFKVYNALFKDDSTDEEEVRKQERMTKVQREKEQKEMM